MDVNVLQPIIKKGWLKKQRARVKAWQRRWVVLNGACLFYFNREGDLKSLGSIFLHGNRVIAHSFSPDNPDKYLFEILPEKTKNGVPNHETTLFCCDTESDRQDWIRAIRLVMYKSVGGAIFGQPLKDTMEFEHKLGRKIPYIVQECVEFLEAKGLEYEGLYRLPGRLVLIKELQESFDTGNRLKFEDTQADVHTVASLLKLYFRELPDSIIPSRHFQRFMGIALDAVDNQEHSDEDYIPRFIQAVNNLDDDNYCILQFLCRHLYKVSEQSHVNKMTLPNLAMVFGPNIIRHADDNPELFRATAELNQKLALILIKHCEVIFSVSREPVDVPEGNLIDLPLSDCEVPPMQPVYNSSSSTMDVFTELNRDDDDDDNDDNDNLLENEINSVPVPPSIDQSENNADKIQPMPLLRRTREHGRSLQQSSGKRKSESELEKILNKQKEAIENSTSDNTRRYGLSFMTSTQKSETEQDRRSLPLTLPKKDNEEAKEYPFSPTSISSLEDDIDNLRDELIHVKVAAHMEKNSLQSDLDKYKRLYEDGVKEIEILKKQLERERAAQMAAIQKVVDLQIILNDYQTKYGQLDP